MSAGATAPAARVRNAVFLAPKCLAAMQELEKTIHASGLERPLLALVKVRASQINGCTFCIDMHVKQLVAEGEDHFRLHHLAAWRESPLYSARERAALGWCEALTRLSETGAPDADYQALAGQFTEAEQVSLTYAIGAINVWNRLQVGFRAPPARVAAAA
jgi:AhpD family alkylhydroperoxidase